jgi:hypothetical protein
MRTVWARLPKPSRETVNKIKQVKVMVPVRLEAAQVEAIQTRINGSAHLDVSKFIRLAVDWLLVSGVDEVIARERERAVARGYQRLLAAIREGGDQ